MFIFWMGVIFFFSSIPDLKSEFPSKIDFVLRKISHFMEYFVLMFFILKIFAHEKLDNVKFDYKILFCFLIALVYACSDEFHQSLVVGRQFAIRDIAFDMLGAISCYFSLKFFDKKIF